VTQRRIGTPGRHGGAATDPARRGSAGAVRMSTPGAALQRLLRLPAALYRYHAGWLLGHRFLMLTHRGRHTGRLHVTVLEVLSWRADVGEAVVLSGFGRRAQWYRNVLAGGAVEVQIGRERFQPHMRLLAPAEAAAVLADYERRNRFAAPLVRTVISRLADVDHDGSDAARRRVVQILPVLAFRRR